MSEELIGIFKEIKESFCSLINYKIRGNTIEVITPFTTPGSKFISVFITRKNDAFVVTDGGWLMSGEYLEEDMFNGKRLNEIYGYFESYYDLKIVNQADHQYFYKVASKPEMIPNAVHDMAQFISQILTTHLSTMDQEDAVEKPERQKFVSEVSNYIISNTRHAVFLDRPFPENEEGINFDAIIKYNGTFGLVKCLTASYPKLFSQVISKAALDFEIADESESKELIKTKIAVLHDHADGYRSSIHRHYIKRLVKNINRPVVLWTKKEQLLELI